MKLLDNVISCHYDNCSIEDFIRQVTIRTAELVAHWQSIGFCHGVLNTDNMSIIGDTIDYGPFAFMEQYNPTLVANTSDRGRRYAFRNQPGICQWNCLVLADTIEEVLGRIEGPELSMRLIDIVKDTFISTFETKYRKLMRSKLRLREDVDDAIADDLIARLLKLMEATRVDYTNTMHWLWTCSPTMDTMADGWEAFVVDLKALQASGERPNVNPKFILRNYLVQRAIESAEAGDYSGVKRLLQAALDPFNPAIDQELTIPQPLGGTCTSLSCSSLTFCVIADQFTIHRFCNKIHLIFHHQALPINRYVSGFVMF